ncbi:Z1 domain-containing protein [Photobacterium phosphoreum]|uniref:Z1 domain-containing protein n=1 Tax=Photobacterium phosphoreum TaxID=659 RepID=UPI0039AEA7F9
MSDEINTNGMYYPYFLEHAKFPFTVEERKCITSTVTKLKVMKPYRDHPGMLLGKIQSGKTKTFIAIMALGFDNDFEVVVVFTKGTKALATQTERRINDEFKSFIKDDELDVYDVMKLPESFTKWELKKKIVIVCKKQKDNFAKLIKLFKNENYGFDSKRILIIDDEADYASIGYKKNKEKELEANLAAQELDKLRKLNDQISFLQVTATPYSLYLQPENIEVQGNIFRPIRPAFTELVPVNDGYIGSDFYFENDDDPDTVGHHLHCEISKKELFALKKEDRRRFKLEDALTSNSILGIRSTVINFIVGGAIRQLQDEHSNDKLRKLSCLVHTEVAKTSHTWQKTVVEKIHRELKKSADGDKQVFQQLIDISYKDLSKTVSLNGNYLPSIVSVTDRIKYILKDEMLMIASVNSEQQVEDMLDDSGQLKLRAPLNIFIGGNILDRGITINNLTGFYYGRSPKQFQQDTVLQHCRMFGYRPSEDLAVTRFYTEANIKKAMKAMHDSDVALRKQFESNKDQGVVFIQGTASGVVRPCSPNKIILSNTTTLKPYKRLLPVGFQTKSKHETNLITAKIDECLNANFSAKQLEEPFLINKYLALEIIELAKSAIQMEEKEGYTFDWKAMKDAILYMCGDKQEMWCLLLKNRNNKRLAGEGSHTKYVATPDTAKTEGRKARENAHDVPMLALFRQNGEKSEDGKGWCGAPFFWPLVYASGNVKTTIYTNESNAYS